MNQNPFVTRKETINFIAKPNKELVKMLADMQTDSTCPCGNALPYSQCCGPLHQGLRLAETAEQLMRSRYSAYVKRKIDYLIQTTHPDFRSKNLREAIEESCQYTTWLGLKVTGTSMGTSKDKMGKVRFVATFTEGTKIRELKEHSRFKKFQGKWSYCDAD